MTVSSLALVDFSNDSMHSVDELLQRPGADVVVTRYFAELASSHQEVELTFEFVDVLQVSIALFESKFTFEDWEHPI